MFSGYYDSGYDSDDYNAYDNGNSYRSGHRGSRTHSGYSSNSRAYTSYDDEPESWDWPSSFEEKFMFFYLRRYSSQYPNRSFKADFNHNVEMMPQSLRDWYDAALEATEEALEHNRELKKSDLSSSEKLLSINVGKGSPRETDVDNQYNFRFKINEGQTDAICIFGTKLIAVLMHRPQSGAGPLHGLASIVEDKSGNCFLHVRVSSDNSRHQLAAISSWSIKFLNTMAKNVLIAPEESQAKKASGSLEDALHESPEYVFRKKILNWDLDSLAEMPEIPRRITRINQSYQSVTRYYEALQLRLYDEVKASLEQGLEKKERFRFEIKVGSSAWPEFSRDIDDPNPSKFNINCQIPEQIVDEYTEHEVVVQLNPKGARALQLIGILNRNRSDGGAAKGDGYNIKFIFDNEQRMMFANAFKPNTQWEIFALTSLSSYMRLYALTESETRSSTQRAIVKSQIPSWPELGHERYNTDGLQTELEQKYRNDQSSYGWRVLQAESVLAGLSLNEIQEEYILRYLKAEDGLYPLQGPPGTGKTMTICALLTILCRLNRRVLVCAPSNKAVQVIAKRFYEQHENSPVTYIGVEGKVDEKLMPIFYDRWPEQQLHIVKEAVRLANDTQWYPKKPVTEQAVPALKRKLSSLVSQLHALNSQLNYVRSFVEISFPMTLINTLEQWLSESTPLAVFIDSINQLVNARNQIISTQKADHSKKSKKISDAALPKLPGVEEFAVFKQTAEQRIQSASEHLLSNAKIVFCTLVTSARQSIREYYDEHFEDQPFFDDLIIDEAGQSVELESMLPIGFYRVKKTLLVGDTNQLPATVISEKNKDSYRHNGQIIQGANYRRSMMKRLEENGIPVPTLEIQYRMEEAIQRFPSQECYDGRLRPSEQILSGRDDLRPFARHQVPEYQFLHVDGKQSQSSTSLQNHKEANVTVRIAKYLASINTINPAYHIGVITFYRAQVLLIRQLLNQDNATRNIKVSTVDGFQGDENAIILLSLVRSNQESLGFVEEYERLNVALTRAMFALYIIGNKKAFMPSGKSSGEQLPMAYRLVPDAQERRVITNADTYLKSIEPKPENGQGASEKKIAAKNTSDTNELTESTATKNKQTKSKKARPGSSSSQPSKQEITGKKPEERKALTTGKVCRFFNGKPDSCNKGDQCQFRHSVAVGNA